MRGLGATVALLFCATVAACGGADSDPSSPRLDYVGRAACAACHADEHEAWSGSHHDLAMQVPTARTVLGDFGGVTLDWCGVTSTFTQRGDEFIVRTEGDDGELHDYTVAYTFGVTPLQQYLVEFPGGRYQTLPFCWDSRPADAGGQRWFHIYQDERIPPGDGLFWTGRAQNWQIMCAECHSTHLVKNHDIETDSYATTWSEIDVSCEACHGPGREHVAWGESRAGRGVDPYEDDPDDPMGLDVVLRRSTLPPWEIDPETGNAKRERRPEDDAEIDACARCHSRRSQMRDEYVHGGPLLDTHRVALLEEHLYFPDGQIKGEVYVYGSFVQSKMYASGVGCTDCHEPHSLSLRAEGNALCTRCHLDTQYDVPEHHNHEQNGTGAACVACHMPERTYMVVDPRRDHSLRVPRPDLTRKTGSPNACNGCHADEPVAWAEQHVTAWYGDARSTTEHYGDVFRAARTGGPDHGARLIRLASDGTQTVIVRATALSLLGGAATPGAERLVGASLHDADSLVRGVAANMLSGRPLPARGAAIPLLRDPVLGVRVAAAEALLPLMATMTGDDAVAMDSAYSELVAYHLATSDRPDAHVSLGASHAEAGREEDAEKSYRTALRLDPSLGAAYVNLAELFRTQRRDADGEALLSKAASEHPDQAALHHALGLARVRLSRVDAALPSLTRAAELAPDVARYGYAHGVALHSTGDLRGAIAVLTAAHERHPRDVSIVEALATIHREAGESEAALRYAAVLVALRPGDPAARRLLEQLQGR